MGKHKKHPIKGIDSDEMSEYRGPSAPMTDQEREWIRSVANEKRVIKRPIEKPIEIPKEYLSYWESSAEREVKRLNNQYEFVSTRLKGLAEAILGYSKRGQTPPKELLSAHKSYLKAIVEIKGELGMLRYALRDIDITSLEAMNNA